LERNEKNVSKKLVIRIVIPVIIIVGLVIVWMIKNPDFLSQEKTDVATVKSEQGTSEQDNNIDVTENNSEDASSDFSLDITEEINLEQLKSYGVPIIIDFGADTCIPCKEMAPILKKLNEDLQGKAIVKFVDVWKYPDLAQDYPVSIIPTQVFFDKDGNPYVPSESSSDGMTMYTTKDTNEHVFTTHQGGISEDALLEILGEMGMDE